MKFTNISWTERDGISAIKFEAERIHFLSDVFIAVAPCWKRDDSREKRA